MELRGKAPLSETALGLFAPSSKSAKNLSREMAMSAPACILAQLNIGSAKEPAVKLAHAVLCMLRVHVPPPGISLKRSRVWCCGRCHALVGLQPQAVMMKVSAP